MTAKHRARGWEFFIIFLLLRRWCGSGQDAIWLLIGAMKVAVSPVSWIESNTQRAREKESVETNDTKVEVCILELLLQCVTTLINPQQNPPLLPPSRNPSSPRIPPHRIQTQLIHARKQKDDKESVGYTAATLQEGAEPSKTGLSLCCHTVLQPNT
jgi:hypothetical protein